MKKIRAGKRMGVKIRNGGIILRNKSLTGFTLIELMIIVAILSILMVIALPKFGKMIQKAYEGRGKGNLGALRSAMSIYYADNEGNFPDSLLSSSLVPSYIDEIPGAYTGQKQAWGKDMAVGQDHEGNNRASATAVIYNADNNRPYEWYWNSQSGKIVRINCTLKDSHDNYITSW